jgi:hypothetical protein
MKVHADHVRVNDHVHVAMYACMLHADRNLTCIYGRSFLLSVKLYSVICIDEYIHTAYIIHICTYMCIYAYVFMRMCVCVCIHCIYACVFV